MTDHRQRKSELPLPPSCPPTLDRREFCQVLGAGWLISVFAERATGQRRGRSRPVPVAARLHIAQNGDITVLTGKVEVGQGSRAQLTQAAAEELKVPVASIRLVMADTAVVPDDGITAGSRTTPSTVPAVRRAAAWAAQVLIDEAARRWQVSPDKVRLADGHAVDSDGGRKLSYGELARADAVDEAFQQPLPDDVALTPVSQWHVLGTSVPRPNRHDLVTGRHRFPSDIVRPHMLYGKVLRPPTYTASLEAIDLDVLDGRPDVVVVHDGDFVGCAAATRWEAEQAVAQLQKTARWTDAGGHPSSEEVFRYLRQKARGGLEPLAQPAETSLRAAYEVAYVQHVPMEPRAAVAEWDSGQLTVWTGTQAPTRVHQQLADAFDLDRSAVRVVVPDTGGGFGGKHSGEVAVEAARLARAAGKPVALRWSREEEFTWAYFRPAAVIDAEAAWDEKQRVTHWRFLNINAGSSAIAPPYRFGEVRTRSVSSDSPLRQGSYRCLAATANNFARESFIDEIAATVGTDPLSFRLAHIGDERLRAVLVRAAEEFDFARRVGQSPPDVGVGLACGTEKGSYVAACVEVHVDPAWGLVQVQEICEVFECGAIQNPRNLYAQVEGCILMGLGGALREQMEFSDGKIRNASLSRYRVPRFQDLPPIKIHLLDRPDLPSVGGGETPIIAVAPAVANAIWDAVGIRLRRMPLQTALRAHAAASR